MDCTAARAIGVYRCQHWSAGKLVWSEDTYNRLYNEGQYAILDIAIRGGTAPASWYMGLMGNNLQVAPIASSTLATLNAAGPYEPTTLAAPGYTARQGINRDATGAGWPTLAPSGSGELLTAATVTFQNTGVVAWSPIRWLFLTTIGTVGDTAGKFVSLAQLSADRLLAPGDHLVITYSLLLI